MKLRWASLLGIVLTLLFIHRVSPQSAKTVIRVGPNIRVGAQNTRQAEPFIAADAKDSSVLIISASEVVDGLKKPGMVAQSYVSNDGGLTWSISELPGMSEALQSGRVETELDNWVALAPNGDAIYTSLLFTSKERAPIYVFRSTDKGRAWNGPTQIAEADYDQPRTTAFLRDGKLRIYIAAASGGAVLLGSIDNGQSFTTIGRVEPDNLRHQAMNPVALMDGSVLLPYTDFPDPEKQQLKFSRIYAARFEDGGKAIGLPHFVADLERPFPGGAYFATDLSAGKFRGNVYASWEDGDYGPKLVRHDDQPVREESGARREVVVARSMDNGRYWSVPYRLRAEGRGPAHFSTLAVSSEGVLGVLWTQDEKYELNSRCYRAWFAASVDAGDTFSSPVAVSDKLSCSDAGLNPEPFFKSRLKGGDYIGLAVSADGVFHAAWIDARDGAFRLYTARIDIGH